MKEWDLFKPKLRETHVLAALAREPRIQHKTDEGSFDDEHLALKLCGAPRRRQRHHKELSFAFRSTFLYKVIRELSESEIRLTS